MVKRGEPVFGDGVKPTALNWTPRFTTRSSNAHRPCREPLGDWRRSAALALCKPSGRGAVPTFFWGGNTAKAAPAHRL